MSIGKVKGSFWRRCSLAVLSGCRWLRLPQIDLASSRQDQSTYPDFCELDMPDFYVGVTPPVIKPDLGSGVWCSEQTTLSTRIMKQGIETSMDSGATDRVIGPYATAHMRHYMENSGADLKLDVGAVIARSEELRTRFSTEVKLAKAFVETAGEGCFLINSRKLGQGYFRQSKDADLFFAIGGYSYWGSGLATVKRLSKRVLDARLDFEFNFYDRYNWDGGKSVSIGPVPITDEFMQQFHRQCVAKEYDIKGVVKTLEQWQFPAPADDPFSSLR